MQKQKQPELRFKGFTEDWEQRKLGDIVDFFNGQRIPIESGLRSEGKYPYYGATGIIDYVEDYIFDGEYVLLAEDGANITMRNSPIAYITTGKFWLNNHAHIMKMITGDNYFLLQLLEKMNYEKYNTGTAQPKLNAQVVKNLNLVLPDNKEQQKIGAFFKSLDDTIALQNQKLEGIQLYKKSMLQKMFPKNGEKAPEIRFEGFTEDWEQRKLSDILKVNSGRDYKHLNSGNIPVYGTGGYMLSVDAQLSDVDGIGIGRKGTIDRPQYLTAPYWTVDTLFYLTATKDNNLRFLFSLAQRINWKRMDESTGVPSLSKAVIEKVNISVPPIEEQEKIGAFFKTLEDAIALQKRKLEILEETKQAFLQKIFI